MSLEAPACEARRFELRVGGKSAAVDELLIQHGDQMLGRIDSSAWWFDRLRSNQGFALRLYFRPNEALNEADVARHLLYFDGLALTATSRAGSTHFGFVPSPEDGGGLGRSGSEPQSVGAFAVQPGPHAAQSVDQLQPFEELLQSCSEFAIEVLKREHAECAPVRKDCAVTIAETLLKTIAGPEEASRTLATVVDRWTAGAGWGAAYLEHLRTAAARDLPIDSIHGTRNRFFREHGELASRFLETCQTLVGDLSGEGRLNSRRDRSDAFQIAAHSILNQMGFSDADILYVAFILQRMGY